MPYLYPASLHFRYTHKIQFQQIAHLMKSTGIENLSEQLLTFITEQLLLYHVEPAVDNPLLPPIALLASPTTKFSYPII